MLDFSSFNDKTEFLSFFEEISKIPRGSGSTGKIADYLVAFAKERGLFSYRDTADNVIIKKPCTPGFENVPALILQGHTDMVIATEPGVTRDLTREGVDIYIDGEFLKARGSTLGADNGIAVAYMLALLDSKDIPHPTLEAVFTSDEEIGLLGAAALDTSVLSGKVMINLDSDEESVFIAGCAGGTRIDMSMKCASEKTSDCYKLTVSGLRGGHSGTEINNGRINAIKLLADIIPDGARIGEISGGNADNAIPRYAECKISHTDVIEENISRALINFSKAENNISITYEKADGESSLFTVDDSARIINLIRELPSGVISMNSDINLPETSMNIGIVESGEDFARVSVSLRSSKESEKADLAERVTKTAEKFGSQTNRYGDYPGWEYSKNSKIREVLCASYEKLFGKKAEVVIIHAGLECGLFSDKIPGLDCVSMGPIAYDIHTPKERLSIPSSIRVYKLLCETLSNYKGENK